MSCIEFAQKRQERTDETDESRYTGAKPSGPVLQKHHWFSGSNPHRQAGFCHAQNFGLERLHALAQTVWSMVGAGLPVRALFIRKDARTAEPVFLTAMLHLMYSKMRRMVPLSRSGANSMTVITKASRRAAITPTTGNTPIQLHADARNALSTAVFYLSQPQANVAGARRKAVQALAALRSLDLSTEG